MREEILIKSIDIRDWGGNFVTKRKMRVKMKKILMMMMVFVVVILLHADPPLGYYDGTAGLMGQQLKSVLHDIIDDHVEHSYNALRDYILPYTDEDTTNPDNVILLYTGWSLPVSEFGGGVSEWNREHVWAKSHGDFDNNPPCGTDAHHIRPTDVSVNSRRGNLDFDDGGDLYIDGDGNTWCYYDSDSWEPRAEVKGDVARMILYMAVRYEGDSGELDLEAVDDVNTYPAPEHGKLSTLLEWHIMDPPDDWEMRRNDRVFEFQENRNPFIDHPEFVSRIWNNTATDMVAIQNLTEIRVYPNPFNPLVQLQGFLQSESDLSIRAYNARGEYLQTIYRGKRSAGVWQFDWDGAAYASGIYFLSIQSGEEAYIKKVNLLK
jgi:endonuclease I